MCVCVMTQASLELKFKVIGQVLGLGLILTDGRNCTLLLKHHQLRRSAERRAAKSSAFERGNLVTLLV